MKNVRIIFEGVSVGKRNSEDMGCIHPAGQPVYTGRPHTGLKKLGRSWTIPEKAEKPERPATGVKAKSRLK